MHSRWSVLRVVFWAALSSRERVGRLIPSFRANASWEREPLRVRRLVAKQSAKDGIEVMATWGLVHICTPSLGFVLGGGCGHGRRQMIPVRWFFYWLLLFGVFLTGVGLLVAGTGDPFGAGIFLPGLAAVALGWYLLREDTENSPTGPRVVPPPTHDNHEEHLKERVIVDTDCKTCREILRRQAEPPPAPRRYVRGQSIGGEYTVLDVRSGGMGVVYVVQPRLSRQVRVLKTYRQLSDPQVSAAFRREAETWVRIPPHPNIVAAESVEWLDSILFVDAEYVPSDSMGRASLRDYIRLGPLSLQTVARFSVHFCYGLRHAVENGIWAHRDIKPENLLVDDEGTLKITDFGLAASVWRGSGRQFLGTPQYASPEQIELREADVRSDIYSFGITLFEMQSGRPAFVGSPVEVLRQHLHSSLPVPDGPLREVILKCTQKKVAERYQSVHQLLEDLRIVFRQIGVNPPPELGAPDSRARALAAKARALANLGKVDEALDAARDWVHACPCEAAAWTELGRLLLALEDLEGARAATEKSLSVDHTRSPAWNNLGLIRSRSGDWQGAVEALKLALLYDNANTGAMLNMMWPLLRLGQPHVAIDVLKRAAALQPEKAGIWVNLAGAYKVAGERDRAKECFDRALKLDPQNARVRKAREELIAGE